MMSESEFALILREAKASIMKHEFRSTDNLRIIKHTHKKILDEDPTCARSLAIYGYSLMALGQLSEGEAHFRSISVDHPDCECAHYFLCLALYQQGNASWDEARREMDRVVMGFSESQDAELPLEIIADFAAASPTLPNGGLGLVDSKSKKIDVLTTSGPRDIDIE